MTDTAAPAPTQAEAHAAELAALHSRFQIEQQAVASGATVESALALGHSYERELAAKNAKPADNKSFGPPKGKTWLDVADAQAGEFEASAINHFADTNDLPADVRAHMLAGNKVTGEEVRLAAQWRERAMADKAWCARFLNGDRDARREMALANSIIAGNVEAKG